LRRDVLQDSFGYLQGDGKTKSKTSSSLLRTSSADMAVAVQSPIFQSLGKEDIATGAPGAAEGHSYWWETSGRDLGNMLHEASYPEEVQRHFLTYYRNTICTHLGPRPESDSAKSGAGWDGDPLEYSWEISTRSRVQTPR
jgi:hypothetical protein